MLVFGIFLAIWIVTFWAQLNSFVLKKINSTIEQQMSRKTWSTSSFESQFLIFIYQQHKNYGLIKEKPSNIFERKGIEMYTT